MRLDPPTCSTCHAPCTTAMMAVFCPLHTECEFWPDDEESARFIESMRPKLITPPKTTRATP